MGVSSRLSIPSLAIGFVAGVGVAWLFAVQGALPVEPDSRARSEPTVALVATPRSALEPVRLDVPADPVRAERDALKAEVARLESEIATARLPSASEPAARSADSPPPLGQATAERLARRRAILEGRQKTKGECLDKLAVRLAAAEAQTLVQWLASAAAWDPKWSLTRDDVPGLVRAVAAQDDPATRLDLVKLIDHVPGPEATAALSQLALAEPDGDVKKAALRDANYRSVRVAGLFVTSVERGSAAEAAGLATGDIITSYASQPTRTRAELVEVRKGLKATDTVSVGVVRGGQALSLSIGGGTMGIMIHEVVPDGGTDVE